MERELETLRQQVAEPTRKIMWVEKSQREAELEQRLAHAECTLEEMRGVEKGRFSMLIRPFENITEVACSVGKGKEVEGTWGKSKKIPATKIVDAEVVSSVREEEFRKRAEEAERELGALQDERKSE